MGRSRFVQRGYRLQRVQTGYLCPEQLVESTSDDPVIDPVAMYPSRDCGILIGGAQLSAKTLRSPDVARSSESLVKPPGESVPRPLASTCLVSLQRGATVAALHNNSTLHVG
jgi:hypothetical protein